MSGNVNVWYATPKGVETYGLRTDVLQEQNLLLIPESSVQLPKGFSFPPQFVPTYAHDWVPKLSWESLTLIFMSKYFLPACQCFYVFLKEDLVPEKTLVSVWSFCFPLAVCHPVVWESSRLHIQQLSQAELQNPCPWDHINSLPSVALMNAQDMFSWQIYSTPFFCFVSSIIYF